MDLEPEPHLQQLIDILRRRRCWIIGTLAFGMTLVMAASLLLPPRYTATAQIVVDIREAAQPSAVPMDEEPILETYIAALTAADFLDRVRLSLADDSAFSAPRSPKPGAAAPPSPPLWVEWSNWLRRQLFAWQSKSIASGVLDRERFRRHLNVYQERGSRVISVAFSATNPAQAALVANRVVELFIAGDEERTRAWARGQLHELDHRIPRIEAALEHDETGIEDYRLAHGITDSKHTDLADQQRTELTQQLTATESDLATRKAKLAFVLGLQRRGGGLGQLVESLDSPAATALLQQETALQQTRAETAATMGEQHPETLRIAAALAELRGKIAAAVARAIDGLASTVAIDAARVQSLRRRLAELQAASGQAQEAEPALRAIERRAAATEKVYESLLQHREQLANAQDSSAVDLRVLSSAVVPDRPSSASPLLFVLPALIVFSIGGGFLAVVADRLDRTFRDGRSVEEALAIPCLGLVPKISRRGSRRFVREPFLEDPSAPYGEAIRSVVAALLSAPPAKTPKTILVTSSLPGEGKTTLAASVATCLALVGKRTLLIDFNLRRAPAANEAAPGVGTTPLDRLAFDDRPPVNAAQVVPGFDADFLAVAGSSGDPLKPFVAGEVARAISRLRQRYDCVVVDGPPLLTATEAGLLAASADRILLVAKHRRSRWDDAYAALQLLAEPGVSARGRFERVGAVLTQVKFPKRAYGRRSVRQNPARRDQPAASSPADDAAPLSLPGARGRPVWGLWAGIVLLCLVIGGTLVAFERGPLAPPHAVEQVAGKRTRG